MTATGQRSLRLGERAYPVVLPSLRDPRLHVAAVIVSIHVLGQVAFRFQVSIVQILIAIVTCGVIEVAWTLWREQRIVWPASALLTGSGVALIFRLVGTRHGDYWSWDGWYVFALVAAFSLATKYVLRFGGSPVFNPSNIGLLVAFVVLGSERAEPLDLWWGPLGAWMVVAYAVILIGGVAITRRLRLLPLAVSFWATLAAASGVLAASGHCITARWAFAPVCGAHFWWILVTSPEVLVFLLFMITDPKTVPSERTGRIAFGAGVAVASTLLIAPQTTEFGAKVALLGGLAVVAALRPAAAWLAPRLAAMPAGALAGLSRRAVGRGAAAGSLIALAGVAIVAAGAPARGAADQVDPEEIPDIGYEVSVDVSALPVVTVDRDVAYVDIGLAGPGAQDLVVALVRCLRVEADALLASDRRLLAAVDHGNRLIDMRQRIDDDAAAGRRVADYYTFDSLHLRLVLPYGSQGGVRPGVEASGVVEHVTYDRHGNEVGRTASPYATTFVMREITEGRWLIAETLTADA